MKEKLFRQSIFILIFTFAYYCIDAQRTIEGQILDASSQESLIGANVQIKDQSGGTITDIDGNFSLPIGTEAEYLVISYTGYTTQEIRLTDENFYQINLESGTLLEEVILVGYGSIKREDATGSVQSVSSENFNKGAITGPQELLAGKVAGVSITTSGDPGGGSKIRIRGESSLNASNDPLIVIDGVPLSNEGLAGNRNPLDIINPNDIETFTVLKDASASAIYGNRASGGVILITTKKGKSGGLSFGATGNVSVGKIANKVDMLTADEFRSSFVDLFGEDHPAYSNLGNANTDWQEEIYETATGYEQNLFLSGNIVESVPFRVSGGYLNKNGVLMTDNYNRRSLGLNVNPSLFDNRLQINMGVKNIKAENHFADRGAIGNALSFDPTQETMTENEYGNFTTWTDINGNPEFLAPTNPLALLLMKDDESVVNRTIANASLDYRFSFLPALRANLNLAKDFSNSEGTVVVPQNAPFAFDAISGGGVNNQYTQERTNDLLEFYLNYKKELAKNTFDLVGGYSWQKFGFENVFTNSNTNETPSQTVSGEDKDELYLLSLFGRLNYSFDDTYLVTLSLRRDGTSRFSPENRWGLFPAAALAVKLIENESSHFNNMKLRLGWGVTGQESIGNKYAYLPQYTLGFETATYQLGDSLITTQRPEGYDANIKWEETTTLNLGLDLSVIRDRVGLSLDLYQKDTEDMLNRIPVAAGTNLTNFITTNIGAMQNKGVELSLFLTPLKTENLNWDLSFNTAYNQNEITKLTATDDPEYIGILTGGISGGVGSNIQIHSVGFAPFSFYAKQQLFDDDGNILEGQFEDLNGDGADNDFYRLFKPAADYSFGLTNNFSYKNISLSFAVRALTGNYVYNNVQTSIGYLNRIVNSSNVLYNVPQSAVDFNVLEQANLSFSDAFIKDASFLRMDHLTLAYNFKLGKSSNGGLSFTIQNPFVLTEYDGLDPETTNGIDNNTYPRPRTFVLGWTYNY